ncbi:MAG: hypothetical protein K0U86_10980 [Planctomycetes bacterium]|nr:hypothetical protein [Planctomycetota bacterium]MCH9725404.1 hypothetical protein [Planctomycetota bacterium]MCH9776501.1 hypothetical protein [Planctomycetota bacterium]MCH9790458.1 hypothetical protein [Planctomycetota bacterium]
MPSVGLTEITSLRMQSIACRGGWLTCLDVKAEIAHQTNEESEYRMLDMNSMTVMGDRETED